MFSNWNTHFEKQRKLTIFKVDMSALFVVHRDSFLKDCAHDANMIRLPQIRHKYLKMHINTVYLEIPKANISLGVNSNCILI